ncbi:MAG: type II toxin-antitoxin system PemK/MazF family toxin [Gammaproteobacteria bacterium]|jgi:mRNA interferase MazF|nr:type II toxin-antitoxin system PemK/MazF family toxin [Gammaproteobacteria bacterium]
MTMLIKTYKPYGIVVVPFPFTDSAEAKRRPALIVSSEQHQQDTGQVTLLMVTCAKHSRWMSDHLIQDLKVTGLTAASFIRLKVFTLDLRLVLKEVGQLGPSDCKQVQSMLRSHFEL